MGSGGLVDEFSVSINCEEYSDCLRNIRFSRNNPHHGVSKDAKSTIKNRYFLNGIYVMVP